MSSVRIPAQRFLHDLFSDCQFQKVRRAEEGQGVETCVVSVLAAQVSPPRGRADGSRR